MANQGKLLELDRRPRCFVDRPHLHHKIAFETSDYTGTFYRVWVMYACTRCGGVVTAWSHKGSAHIEGMCPQPIEVDEALPAREKEYLGQAINSISAPAGVVMLAASAVDAMLKAKGLTEGSLYARINEAAQNHIITDEMAHWAHEVRLEVNDQRHSDSVRICQLLRMQAS